MSCLNRFLSLAVAMVTWAAMAAPAAAGSGCQFQLGFKTLHDSMSTVVGDCQDNQQFAANGDAFQHTSGGLLVWRRAGNSSAFTDGSSTWLNGPCGLQERANQAQFSWEAGSSGCGLVSALQGGGDGSAGAWAAAGDMLVAREQAILLVLDSGEVLMVGGEGSVGPGRSGIIPQAEIFNPGTARWRPAGRPTYLYQADDAAVRLTNGDVLVAGLGAERYSQMAATWTPTGPLHVGYPAGRLFALASGQALFVTPKGIDRYKPDSNSWDQVSPETANHLLFGGVLPDAIRPSLPAAFQQPPERSAFLAVPLLDGRVLVAGGQVLRSPPQPSSGVPLDALSPRFQAVYDFTTTAELFDATTATWSPAGTMRTFHRNGMVARLQDGRVLIAGGLDQQGQFVAASELYVP